MKKCPIVIAVVCLVSALNASEPAVETIQYSQPNSYLVIPETLGDDSEIAKQAGTLKGRSDRATIAKVLQWMDASLEYDPKIAYEWRNYDRVVREGCYGGCADQSIVCGVLLKAAGIPTVWVKTIDVDWICDFKKQRPFEAWSGHVFLEVYLEGKWVLLDPGAKLIYEDYSTKSRILPGNRFAYHKGNDPKQMIMSLEWDEWKKQTQTYFERLDVSLLPVDPKSAVSVVPLAYVIGNDPYYKVLTEMAHSKGWSVPLSFNTDYESNLPKAKGKTLLVETHKGKPVVPIEILDKFYPKASEAIASPNGIAEINGTTIMFVDLSKALDVLSREKN